MFEKFKHYNTDLESSVIGISLHEPEGFLIAKTMIKPEHFFDANYKVAWEIMLDMYDKGFSIDLHTVTQEAIKRGINGLEMGEIAQLITRTMMGVYSSAGLRNWCLFLRELYLKRELMRIKASAANEEIDPLDASRLVKEAIDKAIELEVDDDWVSLREVLVKLQKHMQDVKDKNPGVMTGFTELDTQTNGLQPGWLVILGARPSVGKSAFATALAMNAAKAGNKVGIITLEMPDIEVAGRMTSIYTGDDFWRIYQNQFNDIESEKNIYAQQGMMSSLPIHFSSKTNVTTGAIRAKANRLKNTHGLDLLIIDYLQLIDTESGNKNDNREREVAKLSRGLKLLAMELKIPVLVLAQLNRESEKVSDKKPKVHHLRESGALEQDGDLIMMLHRDWKAGITYDNLGNSTERQADLLVEKNRNGYTGPIKLGFDPERMRFHDYQEGTKGFAPGGFHTVPQRPYAGMRNFYEPKNEQNSEPEF